MDFRGLVFKRVWKRTIFALNLIGLWFGELGGTPPPRIPRSTPRAPPVGLPQPIGAQRRPITLSEQIPCTRVTAISLTSLCLEWIWCEFRLSFRSHKPVSRRTDLKMVYFLAFKDVYFSFLFMSYTQSNALDHRRRRASIFRGKRVLKCT